MTWASCSIYSSSVYRIMKLDFKCCLNLNTSRNKEFMPALSGSCDFVK